MHGLLKVEEEGMLSPGYCENILILQKSGHVALVPIVSLRLPQRVATPYHLKLTLHHSLQVISSLALRELLHYCLGPCAN